MLDERRVGRRVDRDGLLHQPVEQLPAMAGRAPVEPKRELIQVAQEPWGDELHQAVVSALRDASPEECEIVAITWREMMSPPERPEAVTA